MVLWFLALSLMYQCTLSTLAPAVAEKGKMVSIYFSFIFFLADDNYPKPMLQLLNISASDWLKCYSLALIIISYSRQGKSMPTQGFKRRTMRSWRKPVSPVIRTVERCWVRNRCAWRRMSILTSGSLRLQPHTAGETIGVVRAKGIDPSIVVVAITWTPHGVGFCGERKKIYLITVRKFILLGKRTRVFMQFMFWG